MRAGKYCFLSADCSVLFRSSPSPSQTKKKGYRDYKTEEKLRVETNRGKTFCSASLTEGSLLHLMLTIYLL